MENSFVIFGQLIDESLFVKSVHIDFQTLSDLQEGEIVCAIIDDQQRAALGMIMGFTVEIRKRKELFLDQYGEVAAIPRERRAELAKAVQCIQPIYSSLISIFVDTLRVRYRLPYHKFAVRKGGLVVAYEPGKQSRDDDGTDLGIQGLGHLFAQLSFTN